MTPRPADPGADAVRARFEELVASLLEAPHVTRGSGFGSVPGLRVRDKIFAMVCRGELVVKLPAERVARLVELGQGRRFDARGDGRLMKEWASVSVVEAELWPELAREALAFVGATTSPVRRPAP